MFIVKVLLDSKLTDLRVCYQCIWEWCIQNNVTRLWNDFFSSWIISMDIIDFNLSLWTIIRNNIEDSSANWRPPYLQWDLRLWHQQIWNNAFNSWWQSMTPRGFFPPFEQLGNRDSRILLMCKDIINMPGFVPFQG